MNRKNLLTVVALLAVTLITSIVATRCFVTLQPYEAPTSEVVTERPTAAMGTSMSAEQLEASRYIQEMMYEQASMAAQAEQAQMELTMNQSQDKIASQFEDKEALTEYVKKGLADGSVTLEELYDGTLLVGDYSVATVSLGGYLKTNNCIGRTDADLDFLSENIISIVAAAPETLILQIGMYELNEDVTQMQSGFIQRYLAICTQLQQLLPGTKIVIGSIFPVTNETSNKDAKYANRVVYNAALQAMCTDNGWQYLSNESIVAEHADLYGDGGVFLSGSFYTDYWLPYVYVQSRNIAAAPVVSISTEATAAEEYEEDYEDEDYVD